MTETQANDATVPAPGAAPEPKTNNAARAALWFGIIAGACASAAATYLIVRAVTARRPGDETTERIQSLIDEANRLIRTLEEKK